VQDIISAIENKQTTITLNDTDFQVLLRGDRIISIEYSRDNRGFLLASYECTTDDS
jgi:hypothetical protein